MFERIKATIPAKCENFILIWKWILKQNIVIIYIVPTRMFNQLIFAQK